MREGNKRQRRKYRKRRMKGSNFVRKSRKGHKVGFHFKLFIMNDIKCDLKFAILFDYLIQS